MQKGERKKLKMKEKNVNFRHIFQRISKTTDYFLMQLTQSVFHVVTLILYNLVH